MFYSSDEEVDDGIPVRSLLEIQGRQASVDSGSTSTPHGRQIRGQQIHTICLRGFIDENVDLSHISHSHDVNHNSAAVHSPMDSELTMCYSDQSPAGGSLITGFHEIEPSLGVINSPWNRNSLESRKARWGENVGTKRQTVNVSKFGESGQPPSPSSEHSTQDRDSEIRFRRPRSQSVEQSGHERDRESRFRQSRSPSEKRFGENQSHKGYKEGREISEQRDQGIGYTDVSYNRLPASVISREQGASRSRKATERNPLGKSYYNTLIEAGNRYQASLPSTDSRDMKTKRNSFSAEPSNNRVQGNGISGDPENRRNLNFSESAVHEDSGINNETVNNTGIDLEQADETFVFPEVILYDPQFMDCSIQCFSVRIGNYRTENVKVNIRINDITMRIRKADNSMDETILELSTRSIIRCTAYLGKEYPAFLVIYTTEEGARVVRDMMGMNEENGIFYDPEGVDETKKRIMLCWRNLKDQHIESIRHIFKDITELQGEEKILYEENWPYIRDIFRYALSTDERAKYQPNEAPELTKLVGNGPDRPNTFPRQSNKL